MQGSRFSMIVQLHHLLPSQDHSQRFKNERSLSAWLL